MIKVYGMNMACGCRDEQLKWLVEQLPEDRANRAYRLKNNIVAGKYILSSALMQYCLAMELGVSAGEIDYRYGRHGKPMLTEEVLAKCRLLDFNLSHSGDYAVFAISDAPVGIDVEYRKRNKAAVARRCFCKAEYDDIMAAATPSEQDKRFLSYWTMKEAYVKRSGEGLHVPLNSFLIQRGGDTCISCVNGEDIYFATLFLEDGQYCVSVCSDKREELCGIQHMEEITFEDIVGGK